VEHLDANLKAFREGIKPDEREASFDYCFNYFQSFRESNEVSALANRANVQNSCLHLGFYLASWGMYRGSAGLLKKSARCLTPIIDVVAQTSMSLWEIDAHCYTGSNIERLLELANRISNSCPDISMTETLTTKILLGVFGSAPAFDTNVKLGCKVEGIVATFGAKALRQIADFYQNNAAVIDGHRTATLDFGNGGHTQRRYTRAKVIDMALLTQGEKVSESRKLAHKQRPQQ